MAEFQTEEEAVLLANSTDFGLGGFAERDRDGTESSRVWGGGA